MVEILYCYDWDLEEKRTRDIMIPVITVEDLEEYLDELNSKLGDKERLCIFCGANKYNTKEGIIHNKNCIIIRLRKVLKNGI